MKVWELTENGGRIVKGVNTTADVDTDEIKKQAAKFGNKVDKDGRPPTLSSKVKGKSTNVLFNLGLSESVKLKFQRGEDFDTLHIKPKNKNRVELRGKPGYERGNYDAQDKLHQVLDNLGKAANFSELMNGEVVTINPKHPDGERANKTAQDILSTEGLEKWTPMERALMEGGHSIEDYYQTEAKEIASSTEIYVDMDGVLADFFGEWARLMDVDHFTDINKKHDIDDALQKIRDTDDFWLRLPLLPEAKNLLNLIKQIKGEYYICTSPLADDPNSEKHKRTWVEENLAFFPPKAVYVTHNKPQYATGKDGTPNILIDDYGVNIRNWEAAGGVGFKYKDHKFERTAKSIKQHMQEPVEEGSVTVPARQLHDMVLKLVNDVDYNDTKTLAKIARTLGKEVFYKNDRVVLQDPDFDFYQDESLDEDFWDKAQDTADKVSNKLNAWLNKIFAVGERWWQKQVDEHELAWKEVEELLKPYAEELRDLIRDPEDFAMLLFLIKHNQSKKPFMQKVFAKIKRYGLKGAYALEKELQKRYPPRLDYRVSENFADGKKKGKSRPGRVKRAGASCNGSVTALRKRAKNSSGEKAKMYHWCANMKSGRKKK